MMKRMLARCAGVLRSVCGYIPSDPEFFGWWITDIRRRPLSHMRPFTIANHRRLPHDWRYLLASASQQRDGDNRKTQ